jgi:MoxR-like ATPase
MSALSEKLDFSLYMVNTAREMNAMLEEWPDVMVSGLSGSGKTSITKQWAEDNGILLVPYDLSRDVTVVYEEDRGGILRPVKAEDPVAVAKQLVFDKLKEYAGGEDFVLFLDDYHRATKENLEAIYYTIDTHEIVNPATGEEIELDNMLFTVALKTEGV